MPPTPRRASPRTPSAAASSRRRLVEDGALKDRIQRLWLAWTDEADADGLTDFYGLQAMAARAMFEAGECFLRFRPRRPDDGLTVPLQLQMLSSEHLPLGKCETLPNGNEIIFGIELDRIGRRVAYHFHRTHPGDVRQRGAGELVRVPADQVCHVFHPIAEGQIRGVPWVAPAMVRLWLLDQYDDAELDRKKVAAMFAGFVTRPGPDDVMGEDSAQKDAGRRGADRPAARDDAAAAAGRGHQVLRPGRRRRQLRGVPVPHAAGLLLSDGRALHQRHRRPAPGELLEPARGQARVPAAHRAVPARHAGVPAVPPGLAALDPGCGARRRAGAAGLRSRPGAVSRGQVDPAEVGLGRSAQGPQGRDRGDRGRPQVPLRRHRERGLRRRGGRPAHRRRPCARGGARAQVRPARNRAGEPAVEVDPEDRERPTQSEEQAA